MIDLTNLRLTTPLTNKLERSYQPYLNTVLLFYFASSPYHLSIFHLQDFPKLCPKTDEVCTKICNSKNRCHPEASFEDDFDLLYLDNLSLTLLEDIKWYKVDDKKQIFEIFDMIDDYQSYQLVAGNTAHGECSICFWKLFFYFHKRTLIKSSTLITIFFNLFHKFSTTLKTLHDVKSPHKS